MISYEQWLRYCSDVTEDGEPGERHLPERVDVETVAPPVVAAYLARLLTSSDVLEDLAARGQLASTLWFLFGPTSMYTTMVISPSSTLSVPRMSNHLIRYVVVAAPIQEAAISTILRSTSRSICSGISVSLRRGVHQSANQTLAMPAIGPLLAHFSAARVPVS
jgi:cytochrome c biogenesis protein CcdA